MIRQTEKDGRGLLLLRDKCYGVNWVAVPVVCRHGLLAEGFRFLPRAVVGLLLSWHDSIRRIEDRQIQLAEEDMDTGPASLAVSVVRSRTGLTCVDWSKLYQELKNICPRTSGYARCRRAEWRALE